MPSPAWLPPFFLHPQPIRVWAVLVQADVATLFSPKCCMPVNSAAGQVGLELQGALLSGLVV